MPAKSNNSPAQQSQWYKIFTLTPRNFFSIFKIYIHSRYKFPNHKFTFATKYIKHSKKMGKALEPTRSQKAPTQTAQSIKWKNKKANETHVHDRRQPKVNMRSSQKKNNHKSLEIYKLSQHIEYSSSVKLGRNKEPE